MRLLNTTTLKLKYFVDDMPFYTVLSHVWGKDEVTFDDIDKPYARTMTGFEKIAKCCEQAAQDGFEWVWIDTCCIDKRSSAELSEAINSMYKWYWQAEICYAFLEDVPEEGDHTKEDSKFQASRWFRRGWTLQELLAPTVIEFYGTSWGYLGTKSSLLDAVQAATNIDKKYLMNRNLITNASIATKFSWASLRHTSRPEDIAYCLLGLVQVNMPMLYGEGERAFYRLQLEIIKRTNDHSIFAWNPKRKGWDFEVGWNRRRQLPGVLAPSPAFFELSAEVSSLDWSVEWRESQTPNFTYEMTNKGLRMTVPCREWDDDHIVAHLQCQFPGRRTVGILLERIGFDQYQRSLDSDSLLTDEDVEEAELMEVYLLAESPLQHQPTHPFQVRVGRLHADCPFTVIALAQGYREHVREVRVPLKRELMIGATQCEAQRAANKTFVLTELVIWEGDFACIQVNANRNTPFTIMYGLHRGQVRLRSYVDKSTGHGPDLDNIRTEWSYLTLATDDAQSFGFTTDFLEFMVGNRFSLHLAVEVSAKKLRVQYGLCWSLTIKISTVPGEMESDHEID